MAVSKATIILRSVAKTVKVHTRSNISLRTDVVLKSYVFKCVLQYPEILPE